MHRPEKLFGFLLTLLLSNLPVWTALFGFSPLAGTVLSFLLSVCFAAMNVFPIWGRGNFTRLGVMLGGEILTKINLAAVTANTALNILWFARLGALGLTPVQPVLSVLLAALCAVILACSGLARMLAASATL